MMTKTTRTRIAAVVFISTALAALPASAQTKDTPTPRTPPPAPIAAAAESPEAPIPDAAEDLRKTSIYTRMVLKVLNPEEARTVLTAGMKKLGGYATLVSDNSIVFKVPPKQLNAALPMVGELGMMLEKSIERQDLTQAIATLEGQLKSKMEVLSRLRGFFDSSNFAATLDIETNMASLVMEIEQVKGTLRLLNDRSQWAVIEIRFEFFNRDRIIYTHSPFDWLNTISLDALLEKFQ